MKNKKGLKGVAIIMSLLSMLGLGGCTANTPKQREKDNAKALEFLEKKYGEEFKISESIHEVNSPSGGVAKHRQGCAYCVDNPDETFWVYVDKDNGEIQGDTYQNITMRPYAQEYYEKIIKKNWNDCRVSVSLTCLETKEEIYSKDNYEAFLTNEGGYVSVMVFIQKDDDDTQKEAEEIYSLSKELKEMKRKGTFSYFYTTNNSSIDYEEMKNTNKSMKDHIKDGAIVRECVIFINDGASLDIQEIKKDLDKK